MQRLKRKGREDIIFERSGGFTDLIDNTIKEVYRIDDNEYNYLAENMSDEETDLFVSEFLSFTEKRKLVELLDKYLSEYENSRKENITNQGGDIKEN